MRNICLSILLVLSIVSCFGQNSNNYLVVFAHCQYGTKRHFCEYSWIIPADSCRNGIDPQKLNPLFFTENNREALLMPDFHSLRIGTFPNAYEKDDFIAWPIYKKRRKVYQSTQQNFVSNTESLTTIYITPIRAKVRIEEMGLYKKEIVVIDSQCDIWSEFWRFPTSTLQQILSVDFDKMDYTISADK